jgi:hypothetical protein
MSCLLQIDYDDSAAGRLVYSYDAAPQLQAMPDAVIAPRSADDVHVLPTSLIRKAFSFNCKEKRFRTLWRNI